MSQLFTKSQKQSRPPSRQRRTWWKTAPPGPVVPIPSGDIVCADALQALQAISDEVADIVFLDPPFNLGKDYGSSGPKGDRLDEDQYARYIVKVITEATRILKPGGALYLYHIPRWALRFSSTLEGILNFRHWIAISMKNGFVRGPSLYPAHYALLFYTKGAAAILNRPKIRPLTCPNCNEYVKDYGGYRAHVENGVNLSDVWDDLSPVRHSRYKHRNANELPLAVFRRIIGISGLKRGLIIDPFAGAGGSAVAARLAGMRYILIDREETNCSIIKSRIEALTQRKRSRKDGEDEC